MEYLLDPSPHNDRKQHQHHKNEEDYLGYISRTGRDAGETEDGSNNGYHQKNNCPA
jgi:hypothetical protein